MRKLVSVLLSLAFVAVLSPTALAAKKTDTCAYIKDGTIRDKFGNIIELGYNALGYNYEAHMFNGMYCAAYDNAGWCQQFKDVSLMMKWNDAWLSNKDCGTQGSDQGAFSSTTSPDGLLDRHYPTDSYIGSGAWLTNHAKGTYISSTQYRWDLAVPWKFSYEYQGNYYEHSATITQSGNTLNGDGGYPADGSSYQYHWNITEGNVTGDAIHLVMTYDLGVPTCTMTMDGTLVGGTITGGTWSDDCWGMPRSGKWSSSDGLADKIFDTVCTVSDFVKIVAVPTGATKSGDTWYTAGGEEIGKEIWGSFAIIQEKSSDTCGEYEVINYKSSSRKGLGNW